MLGCLASFRVFWGQLSQELILRFVGLFFLRGHVAYVRI